ncbi:polysaccharide deacetylase family protein [Candidatus Manganitrophus noduliformans]|nr:polysaccharide deacetylase family protein [Candidatus Manganitrophus noduliformans]
MSFKRAFKCFLVRLPFVKGLALSLTRHVPRILMYHRFEAVRGGDGTIVSRETFEWQIGVIKADFRAKTLSECIEQSQNGGTRNGIVALTIDDGYDDFYAIAYPILLGNGIPATLFVVTSYVGGESWFWWDRLRYILKQAPEARKEWRYQRDLFIVDKTTPAKESKTWHRLADYCMTLSESERLRFIGAVADMLGIVVPDTPVGPYKQIGWDRIVDLSNHGVEIGSHTVSHRILTDLDDGSLRQELELSKKEIEARIGRTVKTFCYPNGQTSDYNEQVVAAVEKAGYQGAVVAHEGPYRPAERYKITRVSVSEDRIDFLWKIYGMDFLIMRIKKLFKRSVPGS